MEETHLDGRAVAPQYVHDPASYQWAEDEVPSTSKDLAVINEELESAQMNAELDLSLNAKTASQSSAGNRDIEARTDLPPANHLTRVCAFCRQTADARTFVGKFCSKRCLGRNAVWHRKNKVKSALMLKQPRVTSKGHFNRQKTGNNVLKIRRRKSIAGNDKDYEPRFIVPRRKSNSGIIELPDHVKKSFLWDEYLDQENARAVPLEVFRNLTLTDPFPASENKFKVGWLLEAIDPEHQSLIGLVLVVNIIGQRLRLHFEGFPSTYDFWVNCYSPFIFPCGFGNKTGRRFAPPIGFESENFDCKSYAAEKGFKVAPEDAFHHIWYDNNTGFKVFDRVEAVDRQHPELVCVATITDALGDFVLVHFDGWNSYYDYWTAKSSAFIKPVGWCSANNRELSPPLDLGERNFSWQDYLTSKSASAADPSCFSNNRHGFEEGMKLEVVDSRNLIVTRVATIAIVEDYRVLVHMDGWSDLYNIWMDVDNRYLHPAGWSAKTGELLLTPYDKKEVGFEQDSCSVRNCLGHGHVRHERFVSHHSDFGCPYSQQNLNRESLPDRFLHARTSTVSYDNVIADFNNHTKPDSIIVAKKRRGRPRSLSHFNSRRNSSTNETSGRRRRFEPNTDLKPNWSNKKFKMPQDLNQPRTSSRSIFYEAAYIASIMEKKQESQPPLSWQKHVFSLPEIKGKTASDVNLWTIEQVATFVEQLTGKKECAQAMRSQEIDGKAFLLLTQSDISSIMKLKLGPSLKISNAILSINQKHRLSNY